MGEGRLQHHPRYQKSCGIQETVDAVVHGPPAQQLKARQQNTFTLIASLGWWLHVTEQKRESLDEVHKAMEDITWVLELMVHGTKHGLAESAGEPQVQHTFVDRLDHRVLLAKHGIKCGSKCTKAVVVDMAQDHTCAVCYMLTYVFEVKQTQKFTTQLSQMPTQEKQKLDKINQKSLVALIFCCYCIQVRNQTYVDIKHPICIYYAGTDETFQPVLPADECMRTVTSNPVACARFFKFMKTLVEWLEGCHVGEFLTGSQEEVESRVNKLKVDEKYVDHTLHVLDVPSYAPSCTCNDMTCSFCTVLQG
ncbi:hypothetical protein IMY05_C4464000200 [Salix suchowensis]|nr:hypothetical protein IMY05_C4464000200 [Salix suchowensis]